MNEHWEWVIAIALLATVSTGGGSSVGGDVDAGNNVAMRDIIYADQLRDHREEMRDEIMELRRSQNYQWLAMALMAVIFLFAITIASGVIVRQFDYISLQIERRFDLIDRKIEQRIP